MIKCPICSHDIYYHWDERGCHYDNCKCLSFYEKPPQNAGKNKKVWLKFWEIFTQ